jgi:hypothetical protein
MGELNAWCKRGAKPSPARTPKPQGALHGIVAAFDEQGLSVLGRNCPLAIAI